MTLSNGNENSCKNHPVELLTLANLQDKDWDVIIVGDGSGSMWGRPGGWGALVFDKHTNSCKTLYGGISDTTVNICELIPYIHALQWYTRAPYTEGAVSNRRIRTDTGIMVMPIIHIFTDCDVIAKQGNYQMARDANAAYWAALDYFKYMYDIYFHWIPRDVIPANKFADYLSKSARHVIQDLALAEYHNKFGDEDAQSPVEQAVT
jgi:ribonuclease HI